MTDQNKKSIGKGATDPVDQDWPITGGQNLYDTVCALIWCPKHKKVALSKINSKKGYFFPSTPVKTGSTWSDCIGPRVKEALKVNNVTEKVKPYLSHTAPKMTHILRLQMPSYLEFISRVIFFTELTYDRRYSTNCCVDTTSVNWYSAEDIINHRAQQLWGSEVEVIIEALVTNALGDLALLSEYSIMDSLVYYPRDRPKSWQDELVKGAGFTEKDINKLYSDFFQHTFPSQYMNQFSFDDYLNKLGSPELIAGQPLNLTALHRAFSLIKDRNYISFTDLLLGFCALDRSTPHSGKCGQQRASYIYRYYNQFGDRRNFSSEDMKSLAQDMIRVRSDGQLDESKVETEMREIQQALTGGDPKRRIDENSFIRCVGERRLKGCSQLFRSVASPLQQIRMKRVYESIKMTVQSATAIETKAQNIKGTCLRCRQKKYALAVHTVRLSRDGLIMDPQENKGQSDVHRKSKSLRKQSEKAFSIQSAANFFLDVLRNYAYSNITGLTGTAIDKNPSRNSSNKSTADVWANKANRLSHTDKIISLLDQCEKMFKKESRVIRVSSPVFVLGDIHGNFHDLMTYERSLWKMGPTCIANSFLFLGDYVDRGEYSVECILYLLANKIISPEKYWLLRGNHELRPVQQTFTFKNECLDKFGPKAGLTLWEAFNKVFDLMPICAIIDESIFCAHGGIPAHAIKVEELLKIPSPLPDPETQSRIAWEMLWNDPVTGQEFRDYLEMIKDNQKIEVQGFLPNTKRGTAYFFSDEALNRFLTANQLSHVIRAHEVIPNGFALHMGGKCITIFSSSKYCNGLNEAAVVLVDDEKIRIIKVDTN